MTNKGYSKERIMEILNYALVNGEKQACQHFGIQETTYKREKRRAKKSGLIDDKFDAIIKLTGKLSTKEINSIASGSKLEPRKTPIHNFKGKTFKFLAASDLHIGSNYTNYDNIAEMFDIAKKEKCEFATLSGDICEGMSGRPGHVYELTEIGYEQQKKRAIEILGQTNLKTYMIDGNHDRWFIKSSGALIVKDICKELDHAEFVGHDEADIIVNGIKIRLWHGEDSSSYALSYRIQKLVESFTGGEKPNILLAGHVHKAIYCFERHIHCFSTGCIQSQSKWMRGKRIAAHTGFWIIEVTVSDRDYDGQNSRGVGKITSTWYPFYV